MTDAAADATLASSGRPLTIEAHARPADPDADAVDLRARAAAVNRGAVRAAVLGVNDGLVTNVCLILAVAGATSGASDVRIAGFASLLAGAFSMAAGEWISVKSQVELYDGIIADLRRLTERNPRLVLRELAARLEESGFNTETANRMAAELPLDEDEFCTFSARTLFGFDTDQLGSPVVAAASSFALFAVGATIPLVPWFFIDDIPAVLVSVVATAIASMVVGGWVSRSADRPWPIGAARQLVIVVAASAVTYAIGNLFGTALA